MATEYEKMNDHHHHHHHHHSPQEDLNRGNRLQYIYIYICVYMYCFSSIFKRGLTRQQIVRAALRQTSISCDKKLGVLVCVVRAKLVLEGLPWQ